MKRYFLLAAICFATVFSNDANAQPGLGDMFGQKSQSQNQQNDSPANLGKAFEDAGFKMETNKPDLAEFYVKESGINYPVVAYLTESKTFVWIQINLNTLPENSGTYSENMKKLITLNGSYGPCFYTIVEESGMIQLVSPMRASTVNAETVKQQVDVMIGQLDLQIDHWDTSKWTVARHVGSWSTNLDQNSTMVIDLRSDGSFDLTNRAGSQVTTISGNYKMDSGMLKMKDSQGNEISGNIQFVDGNHFNLDVNNQSLNFERG